MEVLNDFKPGDILVQDHDVRSADPYSNKTPRGPYTVLDPVRTSRGKLRLRGPRGGYATTWWTPGSDRVVRLGSQ